MIRSAEFTIYTESKVIHDDFNYVKNIIAVCLLNDYVEVFTVRKEQILFFKPKFKLSIKLHSYLTANEIGYKYFKTQEDAIEYGIRCIRELFPLVSENMEKDNDD